MYIIIIGSGRTGKHVIQSAIKDRHEVVVVESDPKVAKWAATNYDCLVIHADASSLETLKEAGAEKAEALITTTNDDAVNLLIIMMGKELGIKKLVSSVTNEDHIPLFEHMGVDTVESPYRLNGQYLYRTVQRPSVKDFMDLGDGVEIVEMIVNNNAKAIGKSIKDIYSEKSIAKENHIVGIKRNDKLIVPHGSTTIEGNDLVLVLTTHGFSKSLMEAFE